VTVLQTGATIAGYRIEGVVGSGGMGVVYEATQLSLDRTVALKVLAPHLGADPAFRERFRREAMLQAALDHRHIVTVHEAGESAEGLFIATRLVRGRNLKQLIESGLAPARALAILDQVAAALDAAHAAGLVHRDVKPQNVLVDDNDYAYLADFGLIKDAREPGLTQAGEYVGTLDYVSPEQIRGEPMTTASDLYAFAGVLYECLSGEVPFPRDTEAALLYAHLSEEPPRLTELRAELPPALDAVVERGLAKDPGDRFGSGAELVAAAQRGLARADDGVAEAPVVSDGAPRASGETIVDPGVLRRAPVVAVDEDRRISRELIAGALVGALALLLGGFLLGRLAHGEPSAGPTGVAVAGPIALSFPTNDWRAAARPAEIEGLALSGPVGLTSLRKGQPGSLVAGVGREARGARLLPPAFVELLQRTPHREAVRLGSQAGFRYRDLQHRRLPGSLTVYAVPTTAGVATIACLAPRADSSMFARCESVATTLVLRGAEALPLGPNQRYAAAVNTALTSLETQRAEGRRALREARTPAAQARAADQLAAAYRAAAAGLGRASPGPIEEPYHRSIVKSVERAAEGYAALAEAARAHRRLDYDRAAAQVERAEDALDRSVRALERIGYKIG
jgi:protein kinase-like protein